ncbi:unnamed protein product [Gordionus sp. m RMFG-2023]
MLDRGSCSSRIYTLNLGNIVVIWIIIRNKKMRTATNYFIVNMSVSDSLLATLNIFFNFIYMINSHWPFGNEYCVVNNFVSNFTLASSVFTLVAISIDRYFALVPVLHKKLSLKRCIITIIVIWSIAFTISFPTLIYSHTFTWTYLDKSERTVCYLEVTETVSFGYDLFMMIMTYFVPVMILAFVYIKIGMKLWWSELIGEDYEKQLLNIKSKRKVVKMMVMVTSIFAICYLPYQTYFLLQKLHANITTNAATQHIFLVLYWFAMSNSMYNPIVYCWLNNKFRQGFKRAFRWCPFINYDSGHKDSFVFVRSESRMHNSKDHRFSAQSSLIYRNKSSTSKPGNIPRSKTTTLETLL